MNQIDTCFTTAYLVFLICLTNELNNRFNDYFTYLISPDDPCVANTYLGEDNVAFNFHDDFVINIDFCVNLICGLYYIYAIKLSKHYII